MTRQRNVLGSITHITGGDHKRYATKNIEQTTEETLSNNGIDKGLSFNNAEHPPAPELTAKCMVQFRPHTKWKGEYGFDWFRGGDSGLETDPNWFGKIVGKHYTNNNYQTVFPDTNSWSIYFKQDWGMYDNILHTYKNYTIPWKDKIKGHPYLYPVPVLTMLNGETHKLSLKIEIKDAPKTLEVRQKKDAASIPDNFKFNVTSIPVKNGKYNLENFLEITCTRSFARDQIIEIIADGNTVCGWLKVKANDATHHKFIPIVIVPVATKINKISIGSMVNGGEAFFKQGLKQSYVFPRKNIIERIPHSLDLTKSIGIMSWGQNVFTQEYCDANGISGSIGKTTHKPMLQFLDEQLEIKYPGKYTSHYKLYFIDEPYPVVKNGIRLIVQGFSNFKTLHGVYFRGHDKSTVTHETLHAMGLPHTFDGISQEAKFTYKAQQTDNLMDYCHWGVDIQGNPRKAVEGKTLFLWQMQALNPRLNG